MSLDPGKITQFYAEAFNTLDSTLNVPPIDVRFYPYVGINHTIRIRDGRIFVRIADMCRDMPANEQRALAFILVSKLLRKRTPKHFRDLYSNYIKTPEIRERATANKRTHGRKVVTSAVGNIYDLNEVFDDVNTKYFSGSIKKPVLTWSARKTFRILGHHDATHDTIAISRSLDVADVPRYVVEYVVFHEMLHIHHPTVHHNGRRYNHTPAFRRDEEKFQYFTEAELWIERNVRKMKRNARKK